jgi:hypothetical protein
VLVTGSVNGPDPQQSSDAVIAGMTFVCTESVLLLCFLFVTDRLYDNPFGKGNTRTPFRLNGIARLLLQIASNIHSIGCSAANVQPSIHLQIRSDDMSFNMLLALGFHLSDPCVPPMDHDSLPLWLNGHMHLVANQKSKKVIFGLVACYRFLYCY